MTQQEIIGVEKFSKETEIQVFRSSPKWHTPVERQQLAVESEIFPAFPPFLSLSFLLSLRDSDDNS